MRITADYHTHTVFSHGKGSVRDNVEAAIKRNLSVIGIADHSAAHIAYGVRKNWLGEYIAAIDSAKREYEGRIEVKRGIELNIKDLDGGIDLPQGYDFDTKILGYHKAVAYGDIGSAWVFFAGKNREKITRAYMLALQRNKIDIVAHPGYGVPVDYRLLGRACADYGVLFEINNKHTELRAEDIQAAASEGARFVISSDAHSPDKVGEANNALALVQKAGLGTEHILGVLED